jgi:hypothetical protein
LLSPSFNASLLLAAIGPSVLVVDTVQSQVITRLEGHVGCVVDAVFCGESCACCATCGDDRSFKVWNLKDSTLL